MSDREQQEPFGALARAVDAGRTAAALGFDWDRTEGALEKVAEELGEVREAHADGERGRVAEELGDLLFAICNVARKAGVDPDAALDAATSKFERRFGALREAVTASGRSLDEMSIDEMEAVWQAVKRNSSG